MIKFRDGAKTATFTRGVWTGALAEELPGVLDEAYVSNPADPEGLEYAREIESATDATIVAIEPEEDVKGVVF